ncbi:MAG: DNA/RNA nuclease SfsA [Firmicutes bacterium]|nr:DNA/RNA nuclease SfsA [Bacillota bacterium]
MKYDNITKAIFISRPNRFIANVEIDGREETVHVKNTGRCKELLIPGSIVYLTKSDSVGRKTKYDLVAAVKNNGMLINIDSQAPNKVMREWIDKQDFDKVISEYTYGDSRIDFYMERGDEHYLVEVKGCTLEIDGIGYFPDAPTERGIRHIRELIKAHREGYISVLVFVVQMDGINKVKPNIATHFEFAKALDEAKNIGVQIYSLPCHIEPDSVTYSGEIVKL